MKYFKFIPIFIFTNILLSQDRNVLYEIINDVSSERIKTDVQKLVSFWTLHTLSDTISNTNGIGAARRWIK